MMQFVLENFDTIFRNKESLDNLEKMVLDLAVRGKLVPQNSEDEPASELLKKIRVEKEKLITEKIIKKEKPLPVITEVEIPFEIPESWEWIRLGEIISLLSGQDISSNFCNDKGEGIPYLLGASNISGNRILVERWIKNPKVIAHKGDLLISCKGTVGKLIINPLNEVNLSRQLMAIKTIQDKLNLEYTKIFLENYTDRLKEISQGLIPGISRDDILYLNFPLPPLTEQERIVEKVERMKVIISKLKEIYSANEINRMNLKKSILAEIESSSSNKDLLDTLEVLFNNFGSIMRNREDVKDIRNLILSLAVKGKLVPQNPEDEPASELLKKIRAEKERLVAEKVIKKEKPLLPVAEDEIPFEIPKSWEWVQLKELGQINPRNQADDNIEASFVPMKFIAEGFANFHETEEKKWKDIKSGFTHFSENDIVVAKITPCFENKKSAIMKNLKNGIGAGTTELYVFRRFLSELQNKYILNIFKTQVFIDKGVDTYTGTAGQQRVKKDFFENYLIPLPPLAEQQRIVEKVESLMKVCDLLESKIEKSENISKKLLESLLK